MTESKRYASHYEHLNDQRRTEAATRPTPVTLPSSAYGPQDLEWSITGSSDIGWG